MPEGTTTSWNWIALTPPLGGVPDDLQEARLAARTTVSLAATTALLALRIVPMAVRVMSKAHEELRERATLLARAREEMLIAEGSDWCWWYGPHHHTDNREEFDQLFRDHLANMYRALRLTPPSDLSRPILRTRARSVPRGGTRGTPYRVGASMIAAKVSRRKSSFDAGFCPRTLFSAAERIPLTALR